VNGKKKWLQNSTKTSFKLKLHRDKVYYLTVQASCNQTLSPESQEFTFTPYKDTKIGPPELSLAGCGNCIQINITLPEADSSSRIHDIQKFYGAQFIVYWRKHKEAQASFETQNKSFTLNNLENGTEYCVWVHMKIRLNNNTEPSSCYCIFTSTVERSRGPIVLGAAAALLILIFAVMTSMFCLYFSGFLKATLPRALVVALSQGYTLTPERTIPDQIFISSKMEKQMKRNNYTIPQPAIRGTNLEEDENEDEKEEKQGINIYMDRDLDLASAESSSQTSNDVTGNSTEAASRDFGNLTVEVLDKVFEAEIAQGMLDQDGAITEGPEVSVMSERCKTGVLGHITGEMKEKEMCESSGNVNLFSVTLAALASCEEEVEEQKNTRDSFTDFFKLSNREPVLLTDSKQTLSHTDSQTDDQTTTQEDFIATGYESRRADTLWLPKSL
ncbi:hypothetical protein L3Q82_017827, partial [Scortum barcoo]